MVTRAVQERQHVYIQYFYFWRFVASIYGYGSVNVCIWLMRSPTFVCEFPQIQSCSYNLPIKLSSETVSMAEWLDGHLGSSRSRVETLLE